MFDFCRASAAHAELVPGVARLRLVGRRAGIRLVVLLRRHAQHRVGAEDQVRQAGLPVVFDVADKSTEQEICIGIRRRRLELLEGIGKLLEVLPHGREALGAKSDRGGQSRDVSFATSGVGGAEQFLGRVELTGSDGPVGGVEQGLAGIAGGGDAQVRRQRVDSHDLGLGKRDLERLRHGVAGLQEVVAVPRLGRLIAGLLNQNVPGGVVVLGPVGLLEQLRGKRGPIGRLGLGEIRLEDVADQLLRRRDLGLRRNRRTRVGRLSSREIHEKDAENRGSECRSKHDTLRPWPAVNGTRRYSRFTDSDSERRQPQRNSLRDSFRCRGHLAHRPASVTPTRPARNEPGPAPGSSRDPLSPASAD